MKQQVQVLKCRSFSTQDSIKLPPQSIPLLSCPCPTHASPPYPTTSHPTPPIILHPTQPYNTPNTPRTHIVSIPPPTLSISPLFSPHLTNEQLQKFPGDNWVKAGATWQSCLSPSVCVSLQSWASTVSTNVSTTTARRSRGSVTPSATWTRRTARLACEFAWLCSVTGRRQWS